MMQIKTLLLSLLLPCLSASGVAKDIVDYVNPFIGTTNYGTTNPGAVCPNGMMSVTPFNVMGSDLNKDDKDKRWWATPYGYENSYFTGFAHVNMSGVGCPEMSALLLMPTAGKLDVDYHNYGSTYSDEVATPGYFSNRLTKYDILTEVTATLRSSRARFTFPKGQGNILLNLGEGLTNESGATLRKVSETEFEGSKLLGSFCYYKLEAVYPLYFVIRVNKKPRDVGYWKKQRPMQGVEAEWDSTAGKYKLYRQYGKELSGDDVGCFFSYDLAEGEQVEVQMGVSFVSVENARENLNKEQQGQSFDQLRADARAAWMKDLSRVEVEGGTEDQKSVFYTALYHLLIHPNLISDVNGEYPMMESARIGKSERPRYTVFSLWDTYRCTHQLLTLLYPERQLDMMHSMVGMYKEWGWLPKWELYGRESDEMDGDPATIVIADTWLRGLRDFDIHTAYEAIVKSIRTPSKDNFLRPDNDDYRRLGFIPLKDTAVDYCASRSIEYYMADFAAARLAEALGKPADAKEFDRLAQGYRRLYDKESGVFRPRLKDGKFLTPFNPLRGANFEGNPGFHEGTAWNYAFSLPFDVKGLSQLMGTKNYVNKLQMVFDKGLYDPCNEPDMGYAYFFSQIKGEAWRTQALTPQLVAKHFHNTPGGLPGNDDTGTMSSWVAFTMMGIYPAQPAVPDYTVTTPIFDRITLHLDEKHYNGAKVVIEKNGDGKYIKDAELDGRRLSGFTIDHKALTNGKTVRLNMYNR